MMKEQFLEYVKNTLNLFNFWLLTNTVMNCMIFYIYISILIFEVEFYMRVKITIIFFLTDSCTQNLQKLLFKHRLM